jgi:hypothetical protein
MNLAHIVLGFDWLVLFLPTLIAAPNLAVSRRLTARLLASIRFLRPSAVNVAGGSSVLRLNSSTILRCQADVVGD